jgi:hypothetical protein
MTPDLSEAAQRALDELYQARLEGSPPIQITPSVAAELQQHGLAIETPEGALEITLEGSRSWEEQQRLARR